jgi:hypothetical protein
MGASSRRRDRAPQSPQSRPRLEVLEDRSCPAVFIVTFGGTMFVVGDNAANGVTITDQGDGNVEAVITSPSNTAEREASNINSIVVLTGGGGDTVDYQLDNPVTRAKALSVDLGGGDDTANLNASAGVNGSYLLASVYGGAGADAITGSIGAIAAGAAAALALDGGLGNDTVTATSDGLLNGALAVAVSGGQDNDTVSAVLTVAAGSTGSLAAAALGGLGNDKLTLNVNDNSGAGGESTLAYRLAVLDGGAGTDTCTATANVVLVFNCEA